MSKIEKQKKYYRTIIEHLNDAIKNNKKILEASKEYGGYDDYFYNYKRYGVEKALRSKAIDKNQYNEYMRLFNLLKNNKKNDEDIKYVNKKSNVIDNDAQSYGIPVRSTDDFIFVNDNESIGKIEYYEYCIIDRHGKPLIGQISRDIMNDIYSLYTKEGIDLTQRTVSRDFALELGVDFYTFQKILRVFKITKSSYPFAPHVLEENSVTTNIEKTLQLKENLFFKKIENEKIRKMEQRNVQLLQENLDLKNKISSTKEWLENINFETIKPFKILKYKETNEKALVLYLSDLHIGAMVETDSLYENQYNKEEVLRRFNLILNRIKHESIIWGYFDRVIVVNLGDALDGYNGETTRGGHKLSQNMDNKEQFNTFIEVMKEFFDELYEMKIANYIDYYSVGTDNHSGDFGYFANKVLETYLTMKYPDMVVEIFQKYIGDVKYGKHTLLFSHGKDDKTMFKNMPLYLDTKTENQVNEYLDYNGIYGDSVHFVKGDLHQSSTCYGKRFRYKNVSSVFGSSKWIHLNFGNTPAACDFDIFEHDNSQHIYEGHILLK